MDTFTLILQEMLIKFLAFLPKAIVGMVIFFLSLYLAGILSKMLRLALERRQTAEQVKLVLTKITRWSVITLGVFVAFQQMGFDLTAFLVSLGVAGFTIGFALQDISKNLIAGLLILLQQPFDAGDVIKVGEYLGTVMNVDLRATEIRTMDGKIVLIPNADVYTSPLTNYSRESNRRLDLSLRVNFGADLERIQQITLDAVRGVPAILADPAPEVAFDNFGSSAIDFTVFCWTNVKENSLLAVRNAVILAISHGFATQGIEIPYPTQNVQMKS